MAAYILRLRAALLLGSLRGDASHVTRVMLALLTLAAGVAAVCWALVSLQQSGPEVVLTVTVLAGAAVTAGFAAAPAIASTSDPLDPRRFAVLGLRTRALAVVLIVAGLISLPVLVLAVIAGAAGTVWVAQGAPVVGAIFGVVFGILTCMLFARIAMAGASMFLRERRSRELTGLFLLVVLVVVIPGVVFFASLEWDGRVPSQLTEAVAVLSVTPLGAAWAFPLLFAASDGAAWVSLAVAVGTLLALVVIWIIVVERVLTTTERPSAVRERGGLGWFAVAPGTPGGVIAARSLIYWFGDRRYLVNIVVVPVAAAVTVLPLLVAGVPLSLAILIPVPFIALFLGWLPHNDIAYDSTAVWMHIASGVRGAADRWGRLVPVMLIGLPLLAVLIPVAVAVHGRWALLPAMIGICVALFFSALGLSSITSAVAPYAVSPPGESPFQQPQRTSSRGVIAQGLVFSGAIALAAPALWFGWEALTRDIEAAVSALWFGVGVGVAVLVVGTAIGAFAFARRGGRIMEFAEAS